MSGREVDADKISFLVVNTLIRVERQTHTVSTPVKTSGFFLSTALSYSLTMERKNPDVLSYSLLILGLCDLCKKVDQQSKL